MQSTGANLLQFSDLIHKTSYKGLVMARQARVKTGEAVQHRQRNTLSTRRKSSSPFCQLPPATIENVDIKQVFSHKYLGVMIDITR